MKNSFIKFIIIGLLHTHTLTNAEATQQPVTPLSKKNVASGVGCMIMDSKGQVLTDGTKIMINSKIEKLQKPKISKTSKKWLGDSIEVTYTLKKGTLLEEEDGFAPGKGPVGTLAVSVQGAKHEMPAREVCNGDV